MARQAQEVQQQHWGLASALLQGQKAPSRANSQAGLQAWFARARGLEDARAKAASPHGRQAPSQFPAARDEEYGGFRLPDAGPASPQAAKWGER